MGEKGRKRREVIHVTSTKVSGRVLMSYFLNVAGRFFFDFEIPFFNEC